MRWSFCEIGMPKSAGLIDLLYLDGLDYGAGQGQGQEQGLGQGPGGQTSGITPPSHHLWEKGVGGMRATAAELSEQFHLNAAEAALPHLAERCLVLIDDTYPDPAMCASETHIHPHQDPCARPTVGGMQGAGASPSSPPPRSSSSLSCTLSCCATRGSPGRENTGRETCSPRGK